MTTTSSFNRRRTLVCKQAPPSTTTAGDDAGGARTVPSHCYDTDNAWNNMAGHLIWLGASEIAAYQARPGADPNRALAAIAAINRSGDAYETREAAAAYELEEVFDFIRLKDGTSAGVEHTRYN